MGQIDQPMEKREEGIFQPILQKVEKIRHRIRLLGSVHISILVFHLALMSLIYIQYGLNYLSKRAKSTAPFEED